MSADKKANPRVEKELSKFLDKVNEMESLMKGMTSGEEETEAKAMERADEIIAKFEEKTKEKQDEEDSIARTGVNRTVINKDAYKNDEDVGHGAMAGKSQVDQAGFIQALEVDARERHERRQQATKEANKLKEKGNEHFKNGEYEKAVDLYAEGLTKIKDLLPLWTNKAMANNKLGRFEEALNDCEWALRVDEKSSKAYLQQGKAYLGLEQFDKARESYNQILECDKNLRKQVDNYLHEVDLAEQSKKENETAKKLFDDENVEALSLFQLIEKVKTPQPRVEYYLGGLQFLHSALRTEQDRLLFKTGHGFTLHEFDMIERSFKRVAKTKSTDLDICVVLYRLYEKACAGLETSQILLFKNENFTSQSMFILESKVEKLELVQKTVFQFLMTCCKDDFGMKLVLGMDSERFTKCLFQHCVATKSTSSLALAFLEILTKEAKFNARLRSMHGIVDPLFVTIETSNAKRQLPIMTSFVRMTSDVQLRRHFNDSPSTWKASTNLLRKFENPDVMNLLFVFLLNITVEKSENAAKYSKEINAILMTKISKSEFEKGIVGLVSHILPKYEVSKESITLEFVELCVKLCKSEDVEILKYSTRCIACVSKDTKFTNTILENCGFENLVKLTSTKSDDVIANSVICITDLLEKPETKSRMKILKKVDFVKTLLVLVSDTLNETVKKNSAILLAKLAQADPVYLERLRELHGVEILVQTVSPDIL